MTPLLTPREELLWLAALLDGEGCFTLVDGKYPNVVVSMTDEDTVRLAHERAGVGNVVGPLLPKNKKHKKSWVWKVSVSEHAFALCRVVLPYMSDRRSKRIQEILALDPEPVKPIWERVSDWER